MARNFDQVPARTHRPNSQTHLGHSTTQTKHVDVEGIATLGTLGPRGFGQALSGHDRTDLVEELRQQPYFHGRDRDPRTAEPEQAGFVQARLVVLWTLEPAAKSLLARKHVALVGGNTNPVFAGLCSDGRFTTSLHKYETRLPLVSKFLKPCPFTGQTHERYFKRSHQRPHYAHQPAQCQHFTKF